MGLLEIGSRVTTVYRADVSDMKAGLKSLQGEERKLAEAQLAAAQDRNKQLEGWKTGLDKMIVQFAAVGLAAKVLWDGYKLSVEDARNANAALGVDIGRLQQAAHGLKTEHELLAFAARASSSAFRNSQADMEVAQKAMLALTREGKDQEEVTNKITDAIASLKVDGLRDLGIYVDTTRVAFDKNGKVVDDYNNKLILHQRVLDALKAKASDVADGEDAVGESMQRSGVKVQDAINDLEKALGQFVIAMKPVIDVLAMAARGWALLVQSAADMPAWAGDKLYDLTHSTSAEQNRSSLDYYRRLRQEQQKGGVLSLNIVAEAENYDQKLYQQLIELRKKQIDGLQQVQGSTVASFNVNRLPAAQLAKEEAAAKFAALSPADQKAAYQQALEIAALAILHSAKTANTNEVANSARSLSLGAAADSSGADLAGVTDIDRAMQGLNERAAAAAAQAQADHKSHLEKIFGPLDDFDAYKQGFDLLTGAVGSAYDAWVSGSESAGTAIKKFLGEAIAATGKQMAIEAIKYGAYALAYSFIDPAAAAGYAASAAAFAAGAVVAGVAAHELGAGGSTSKPSGGASAGGGTSTGGGAPSTPQPKQTIIVIGEAFAESTPRMRQLKAEETVKRAGIGNSALEDG